MKWLSNLRFNSDKIEDRWQNNDDHAITTEIMQCTIRNLQVWCLARAIACSLHAHNAMSPMERKIRVLLRGRNFFSSPLFCFRLQLRKTNFYAKKEKKEKKTARRTKVKGKRRRRRPKPISGLRREIRILSSVQNFRFTSLHRRSYMPPSKVHAEE